MAVRARVKRFTRYFHLEATGTKRAARDGEADTNAGIDTQRWRKPARGELVASRGRGSGPAARDEDTPVLLQRVGARRSEEV